MEEHVRVLVSTVEGKMLSSHREFLVTSACSFGVSFGRVICILSSAAASISTWDFSKFGLMKRWLLCSLSHRGWCKLKSLSQIVCSNLTAPLPMHALLHSL